MADSSALESIFNHYRNTPSDTNEHLPTLRRLASECYDIAEIGCWRGVSTTALLAGLVDNDGVRLRIIDINAQFLAEVTGKLVPHVPADMLVHFINRSSLDVDLTDGLEMLFIDSLHTYEHLKKELAIHGDVPTKYLVFHDTVTYGAVSEDGSKPGLMAAIEEFMEESQLWKIKEEHFNNNGLVVLERR